MRILKVALLVLMLVPAGLLAAQNQPVSMDQAVDRIVGRESAVVASLRKYAPLVETYIQNLKPDKELGVVPAGDRYFLGRADLKSGVEVHSIAEKSGDRHRLFGNLGSFFSLSLQYMPQGFLQMIFLDADGFDRQHYNFEYVRREFLGDVRCLVFDVTPKPNAGKGRFTGRIWVEDQDYTIVRFNGGYGSGSRSKLYFHFDSWRVNPIPGMWLPAYVYSEESNVPYGLWNRLRFKAQTRLWGYSLSAAGREQELSRILVEAPTPVRDETVTSKDLSPIQAQRAWDSAAEQNVIERLERIGLLAPPGEMDKVLDTVINNLEVTNNLDIQPEVHCRVLLTSTLESFTAGHTIVLSRGLVDVLPDEPTLALMLAHELGHVVLGHRIDSQYAFFDRLLLKDEETFQHFIFARDPNEEQAANQKAMELLKNSPYKDQLGNARLFADALDRRAKQVPNLVSPHLGNRVPFKPDVLQVSAPTEARRGTVLAALPLGSRIKVNPWNDTLELIKTKAPGMISEREKMPFEVTPFMPYLTRLGGPQAPDRISAESKPDATKKPD